MPRRTSIMLEVSDEVYDTLVEPLKKSKQFSKLLISLLEGYRSDGYIRAYVDDTLFEYKQATVDSFNKTLDSMSESLSNMGLFTDELEATTAFGREKFSSAARDQSKQIDKEEIKAKETSDSMKDLEKRMEERMDKMQEMYSSSLNAILSAISQNQSSMPNMYGMPNIYGMGGQIYGMPNMGMPNMVNPAMQYSQQGFAQGFGGMQNAIPNTQSGGYSGQVGNNVNIESKTQSSPTSENKPVDVVSTVTPSVDDIIEKATKPINVSSSSNSDSGIGSGNNDPAISDEDVKEAQDIMSFMLEGNSFSF